VPPLGQSGSRGRRRTTCGVAPTKTARSGRGAVASARHGLTTQVFDGLHISPPAALRVVTQATQTPGLPLLPGLQCGAAVLDAQSFSVVQVVALACRQRSAPDRRPGRKDSPSSAGRRRRRPTGRSAAWGWRSRCRWRRRRRSGARRRRSARRLLGQSPESRHSTQARCCRSQTGAGLDAVAVRGAAGERDADLVLATACRAAVAREQAGDARALADIADRRLRVGGAVGVARAGARFARHAAAVGAVLPPPQAASSLQAAEPMQKPLPAHRPIRHTHFCGEGTVAVVAAGRFAEAVGTAETSAMSSRRRTR